MQKIFFFVLIIFMPSYSYSQQSESYQFRVNLTRANGNKLSVELVTPKISGDTAFYRFPAMVPGTYAVYDFGRYISDFYAYDINGNKLSVTKPDVNTWAVANGSKLYKITYDVSGTFKIRDSNTVFEPVGTNIQPDTNFVINNQGFFGYFNGYVSHNYNITFTKPAGFYGATSLTALSRTNDEETFTAPDYHYLVDNPIMFTVPDTASIGFNEANVMISVYSPGKVMNADDIASSIKKLLTAIREYLGGRLPTDKYTFLFYFTDKNGVSGASGALEHNQSSMYFLRDIPKEAKSFTLAQFESIVAHEFMHIVTPLNLHSEEIGNFDFNNPVMSQHLWLYEGETEYSAHYIQLRQGLITLNDYVEEINRELKASSRFNDTLPFTELSKGALDIYKGQYINVYQKGALINLCLDVLIRDESDGRQGLKDIIQTLLEKYGKDRSFKDEELFGEITSLTSPKIAEFFSRYVAGSERLPFKEILDKIGLNAEIKPYQTLELGQTRLGFNPETRRLKFMTIDQNNELAKSLGVKVDDELLSVNSKEINFSKIMDVFGSLENPSKVGDKFEMEVARPDGKGKFENLKLKGKITKTKTAYDRKVSVIDNPTERQLMIRNAWLGK
ncbi:MAG TPA: peptidase M61 [Ignavibacteria bacterium]